MKNKQTANNAKVAQVATTNTNEVTAVVMEVTAQSNVITTLAGATLSQKAGKLNVATYAGKFVMYQIEYKANLKRLAICGTDLTAPANCVEYKALTKRNASLLRKLARIQIGLGIANLAYTDVPAEVPAK